MYLSFLLQMSMFIYINNHMDCIVDISFIGRLSYF